MFPNIGVDLLHLPRLTSLLFRRQTPYLHRFARRILTNAELATFRQQQQRLAAADEKEAVVRWLGVRWAAKEAAFKAGGLGRRLQWKEVEVRYMPSGQPYLQLRKEGITGGLSISHDGEYVVAMAVLPSQQQQQQQKAMEGTGERMEMYGQMVRRRLYDYLTEMLDGEDLE